MRRIKLITLLLVFGLFSSQIPMTNAATLDTALLEPMLVIGGTQGSGQAQFDEPDSVYVDANGNIYAGDTVNLRVQVFDKDGNFLREMTGFTPIEDAVNNEVQGIGELPNGTIVVVEKAGNLYFFDHDGTTPNAKIPMPEKTADETNRDTQGLAVDPVTGFIYITDQPNNKILYFSPDGEFIGEIELPQFSTPENMVVDNSKGIIYVSLEGQRQIAVYGLENGTQITTFGKEYATMNYEGLALDHMGNIIAVDEGPDTKSSSKYSRIIIFNGTTYEPIAAFGSTAGTKKGQFISPDGVAFDYTNKRVVVADQGNYRIQVFDYNSPVKINPIDDKSIPINKVNEDKFGWVIGGALFGGTYTLKMNGTEVESGSFKYGQFVGPDLTKLAKGTYEYEITAEDKDGNTATDSAVLKITEAVEETSSNTSSAGEKKSVLPVLPIVFALVFIPFIEIIRRRKLN